MRNEHPTDQELFDLAEDRLNPVRTLEIDSHLETCAACKVRQARQAEITYQLAEALDVAASGVAFSASRSWAKVAPRLRSARRVQRVTRMLQLAASALALLIFVAGSVGIGAMLRSQPATEPKPTAPVVMPAVVPATVVVPVAPTPRPTGRVTVLVVGVDRRPGETKAGLTDSMLLLSIDHTRQTALMLSIPRDLWVDIPGHGPDRINTAYAVGEENGAGGVTLLKQTINTALSVRVDHVVRLEFNAVVTLIDALGGVDVDVPGEINDPLYPDSNYGYEPLYIAAGRQHLDGALALKYMRTRHNSSDFERAARQQQVLTALRAKMAQLDTWPSVLQRMPELVAQLQGAIATDLNLTDMLALAQQAREVPDGALRTAVLDGRYVTDYVTPEGAQVLLPLNDRVSALVNDIFETGQVPATPEMEMARLAVLNGTPRTGLAASTTAMLQARGFNVVNTGNASSSEYVRTVIIDHAGRPATVKALAELFKVAPGNLIYHPDPASSAEVEVILGADFTLPAP